MGREIEKKYFIDQPSLGLEKLMCQSEKNKIEQYYFIDEPNKEVRIRKLCGKEDKYYFVFKIGEGHNREEVDFKISEKEFNNLLKTEDYISSICKDRYNIIYGDYKIELDLFNIHCFNFYIAEIEFNSEEEYEQFNPPDILKCSDGVIRNVSDIGEFKNKYLAKYLMDSDEYKEKIMG